MAKMSPADKAAIKKRQNQIKEAIELRGTARFSSETNFLAANLPHIHTDISHRDHDVEPGRIEKTLAQSWSAAPN